MLYNVDFEIVGICILLIMYYFINTQYSRKSETTNAFRRFIFVMLLTESMDVITAYTVSYAVIIPVWLNSALNTIFLGLSLYLQFMYVKYVCSYIRQYNKQSNMETVCRYVGGFYLLVLILNFFTGILFSFNSEGKYVRGPLYAIEFILPSFFIIYTVGVVLMHNKSFKTKQVVSIVVFAIVSATGCVIQVIFRPDWLMAIFTLTLGALFCMLALETPDYQRLMETMEELSRAKEKLEKADKAKTEFITNMSHEIRTPINAVLGYNELILKRTQEESIVEYSRNAQVAGRALLSMVNDILDYTNIDDGTLNLRRVEYSVKSLINDILVYIEYNTRRKGLDCKISIDDNIPMILMGDAMRINQIVNNLVAAAVNYTDKGYVGLNIKWQPVSSELGNLCIEVMDTGLGMTEDQIKRIMDNYEISDNTSQDDIDEIGFGLSIVVRLLRIMDAELVIKSELGKGSRIMAQIRQQIVDAAPISSAVKDYSLDDEDEICVYAPEAKVLLADDNKMNLDLVIGLLKDTGVTFDTAVNGLEVIEKVKMQEYDLIFLDHMMPVMDGMEAFREINRLKLCPDTPIIVLTANAVVGAREKYIKEGFDAYLSKPVTQKQLLKCLYDFLPYDKIIEDYEPQETQERVSKDILSSFDFLDTELGLSYCADSIDFYVEMLNSYIANNRLDEINMLFNECKWKDYQINVHALKSTSLSIGAVHMSEEAKMLEFSVRDAQWNYVRENHQRVMQDYQELLERITKALKTEI